MKHKFLSSKSQKVKKMLRKFTDDDMDVENEQTSEGPTQNEGQVTKKIIKKNKKIKIKLQQQQASDEGGDSDNNDEVDSKSSMESAEQSTEGKKERKTIGNVFEDILNKEVKGQYKLNPILSEFTKPLKKVKQELRKEKSKKLEKKIKQVKDMRAYVLPTQASALQDKEYKIIATKGVIKILESIKNYQTDNGLTSNLVA